MTFPILVQPHAGRFQASVLGSPTMTAEGATKEETLTALRANINQQFAKDEVVLLNVPDPLPLNRLTPAQWQRGFRSGRGSVDSHY